jgi:TatA/E family protein of Tat protein translocase
MPFPNIGPGELILILIIALVVLGPGKLPDVAQSLGKSVREFRKAASDITDAGKLDAPPPSEQAAPPAPALAANADAVQAAAAAPSANPAPDAPIAAAPAVEATAAQAAGTDPEAAAASSTRDSNLS